MGRAAVTLPGVAGTGVVSAVSSLPLITTLLLTIGSLPLPLLKMPITG
jgi:hypothetical protein